MHEVQTISDVHKVQLELHATHAEDELKSEEAKNPDIQTQPDVGSASELGSLQIMHLRESGQVKQWEWQGRQVNDKRFPLE